VTIRGDHEQLYRLGLVDEIKGRTPSEGGVEGDLGPAYRVKLKFSFAPRFRLRMTIYPYADVGFVSFTPPNQRLDANGESVPYGWYATRDITIQSFLIKHGFPPPPPGTGRVDTTEVESAPVKKAAGVPLSGSGGGWPPWGWALFAGGLTAATLVTALRFRRRALAR
jgi:hypothetical protein